VERLLTIPWNGCSTCVECALDEGEEINVDPAHVEMRGLPFEIDVTADRRLARVIDDAASSSASWAAASQGLPPFMVQPSGLVSRDVEAFTLPNPLGVIAESR
jgi:hypothetical protein